MNWRQWCRIKKCIDSTKAFQIAFLHIFLSACLCAQHMLLRTILDVKQNSAFWFVRGVRILHFFDNFHVIACILGDIQNLCVKSLLLYDAPLHNIYLLPFAKSSRDFLVSCLFVPLVCCLIGFNEKIDLKEKCALFDCFAHFFIIFILFIGLWVEWYYEQQRGSDTNSMHISLHKHLSFILRLFCIYHLPPHTLQCSMEIICSLYMKWFVPKMRLLLADINFMPLILLLLLLLLKICRKRWHPTYVASFSL